MAASISFPVWTVDTLGSGASVTWGGRELRMAFGKVECIHIQVEHTEQYGICSIDTIEADFRSQVQ